MMPVIRRPHWAQWIRDLSAYRRPFCLVATAHRERAETSFLDAEQRPVLDDHLGPLPARYREGPLAAAG